MLYVAALLTQESFQPKAAVLKHPPGSKVLRVTDSVDAVEPQDVEAIVDQSFAGLPGIMLAAIRASQQPADHPRVRLGIDQDVAAADLLSILLQHHDKFEALRRLLLPVPHDPGEMIPYLRRAHGVKGRVR